MLVTISNNRQVEITANETRAMLVSDVFGLGLGPFTVVGFSGDLPVLHLLDATETEPARDEPIDPVLIDSVDNIDKPKVPIRLPSGDVVLVPFDVAPILQAVIDSNTQLLQRLAEVLSGETLARMQAELAAMTIERDTAVTYAGRLRGALPQVDAAATALVDLAVILRG